MSGKGVLEFVGKSAAFALISGLIWGLILVFIAGFSSHDRGNSSPYESARAAEQWSLYEKQSREVQEQLERTTQQQERAARLLDTQERLYAEQERLQKRFADILSKWERMPSK